MAAYSTTATDTAAAIMGKGRVTQTVHVSTRVHRGGRMAEALVLVVPEGEKTGTYYEVFSDRTIDALMAGMTPEELELEPYEPEPDEYAGTAWDRACSAGDVRYQFNREQEA